jgi:hypothetical protein
MHIISANGISSRTPASRKVRGALGRPGQVASHQEHIGSAGPHIEAGAMIQIDAERALQMVRVHLESGSDVQLVWDDGRRFLRLVSWRFWGVSYEINRSTEIAIQEMIAAKRQEMDALENADRTLAQASVPAPTVES